MINENQTKPERVAELVEYIIESMDMSALESFVRENLMEYYLNPRNISDYVQNYGEMKQIMGDE
jgi:hypothetical protein